MIMEDRVVRQDQVLPTCSVGIMAYNEEANIVAAIGAILRQSLRTAHIAEVIVVASGCTDDTIPLVSDLARQDPRIRVLVQERREGKASAINVFIGAARAQLLLLASADVVLQDGALDLLLAHFQDPEVGMVGGRPVPVNDRQSTLGYAVHLVWRLHDQVAREIPKLGEVVAFRNVVPSVPTDTAVDEISIQAVITQLGYRLVYEPRAVIFNRGPATVADFLRQRRRIYAGHLHVRQQQGYSAATMSVGRVGRALVAANSFATPRTTARTVCTVGLEALARGLGYYDFVRRRPHTIWQIATSTKSSVSETPAGQHPLSVQVFRLVGFQPRLVDPSSRAGRLLAQQVLLLMRKALDPDVQVTQQRGGTILVFLPAGREEAERIAQQLVQRVASSSLRDDATGEPVSAKLACGLIAFQQSGDAQALSIREAV
jgi:GGDEF domain-containing protein